MYNFSFLSSHHPLNTKELKLNEQQTCMFEWKKKNGKSAVAVIFMGFPNTIQQYFLLTYYYFIISCFPFFSLSLYVLFKSFFPILMHSDNYSETLKGVTCKDWCFYSFYCLAKRDFYSGSFFFIFLPLVLKLFERINSLVNSLLFR